MLVPTGYPCTFRHKGQGKICTILFTLFPQIMVFIFLRKPILLYSSYPSLQIKE